MDKTDGNNVVMLIAFYNVKALGVRYLEASLETNGYKVIPVFYKDFNSFNPQKTTQEELRLLCGKIKEAGPMLIGLSVMSSMYLETVTMVIQAIKSAFDIPMVCGGAFASLFPEQFLDQGVDFVIRLDGEGPICQLADALRNKTDYTGIPSLCYHADNTNIINDIGNVSDTADTYGLPVVISSTACFISNNRLIEGDPQHNIVSYELVASRGCPFTCSYCSCVNLRRLLPQHVPYVRTRTVKSVIDELMIVKKKLRHVMLVHFYDEVFPQVPEWVNQFVSEYKKHINLPFTIFSHPKMISADIMKKLISAGLTEVIMGIQSGSTHIRKNIFHRYETQEDIIKAVKIITESGTVVSYDFMLQHPFESIEDLKETFYLIEKFEGPFILQLHGLNFLPGTDIIPMAIDQGLLSTEEMDEIMYAPMQQQFNTYWRREKDPESQLWYMLIYCLQFGSLRKKIKEYASDPFKYLEQITHAYTVGLRLCQLRSLYRKTRIVLKSKQLSVIMPRKKIAF